MHPSFDDGGTSSLLESQFSAVHHRAKKSKAS